MSDVKHFKITFLTAAESSPLCDSKERRSATYSHRSLGENEDGTVPAGSPRGVVRCLPTAIPTGWSALCSDLLLHVIIAECSAELGAAEQERQVWPHQPETTSGSSSSKSLLSSIICTKPKPDPLKELGRFIEEFMKGSSFYTYVYHTRGVGGLWK